MVQDTALSRRQQGFEFPRGRHFCVFVNLKKLVLIRRLFEVSAQLDDGVFLIGQENFATKSELKKTQEPRVK